MTREEEGGRKRWEEIALRRIQDCLQSQGGCRGGDPCCLILVFGPLGAPLFAKVNLCVLVHLFEAHLSLALEFDALFERRGKKFTDSERREKGEQSKDGGGQVDSISCSGSRLSVRSQRLPLSRL